jgi:hypothetical protein
MAMSVTGTTPTASLMRLITIKAPTNSAGMLAAMHLTPIGDLAEVEMTH